MKNLNSKEYVLNHNFNYGTGEDNKDSVIKKLELRNIEDLFVYIKETILDTVIDAKIKNNVVLNMIDEPDTKIIIKKIKE